MLAFFPRAEFFNQPSVVALAHCCVQVNYMQPLMMAEFLQQPEYVGNGKLAPPPVNKLHRLPALHINARNQPGSRPSTPLLLKNSFPPPIHCPSSPKLTPPTPPSPP